MTHHIAKIIEIIGSSDKGWEDAAQVAVDEAKKTLHGIHGIEVRYDCPYRSCLRKNNKISNLRKNIFCRRLALDPVTYAKNILRKRYSARKMA